METKHIAIPTSLFQAAYDWNKAKCRCGKLLSDKSVHYTTEETKNKKFTTINGYTVIKQD